MTKFKVITFSDTETITPIKYKDTDISKVIKTIGIDYMSIGQAIYAGEKAWQSSGRKLSYRIDTIDNEPIMIRYASMDYEIFPADFDGDLLEAISKEIRRFDYIQEYFNG